DARIDRRGCSYRPSRMLVTTDADDILPPLAMIAFRILKIIMRAKAVCKGIIHLGLHQTDSTDAFNTLYIGCEKFPQHDLYPIAIGGVR
ncbi:hypothetical protein, partial [Leyella stercorea]|uniref:hypothetical protein n=1 Tax=Leyella stercorea TaxID=363265 RepID=UPI003FED3FC8